MGRGDKKSKKGKRFKGSYGVVRPRKKNNDDNTIKHKNKLEEKVEKKVEEKKKTTTKKKTKTKKKTTTKKKESKK